MRHFSALFLSCCFCSPLFAQPKSTPPAKPVAQPPSAQPFTSVASHAGGLSETDPQRVGFSADRLQRIDRLLQEYVDKKRIPGAVALVARNGQLVYHKGIGQDDTEAGKAMKREAIFRITGLTKLATTIAVMMLYEEGKLLLDDPIARYIPEFRNAKVLGRFNPRDSSFTSVPAKRQITIRNLLNHTSGISYPIVGLGPKEAMAIYQKNRIPNGVGTPSANLAASVKTLAQLPLMHQPGEKFTYGLNTDVLGYLVELVSGQKLDQFLRTRLFEPLGMKDTYFYLPAEKANLLTPLYTEDTTRTVKKMPTQMNPDYPKSAGTYLSGGSGLCSTALDYAALVQMILNQGEFNGKRILSPMSVRMMATNQIGSLAIGARRFGFGMALATSQEASLRPVSEGTLEWSGILGTTFFADPKENLIGILFINKYPNSFGDVDDKFKVLVYQALTGPETSSFQAIR